MTATFDRLDEEVATDTADTFTGLLGRLNDQSVRPGKHFDAYVDGFDEASAPACDWFVEHLGVSR